MVTARLSVFVCVCVYVCVCARVYETRRQGKEGPVVVSAIYTAKPASLVSEMRRGLYTYSLTHPQNRDWRDGEARTTRERKTNR